MIFQDKYLLISSVFINILALITGILSLALPFWIDAEHDEGEVVVKVLKKSHSGLWQKHDTYEIQKNNASMQKWDETMQPVHDTDAMWAVKVLMIVGLILELTNLIGSVFVCCITEKKYMNHLTTIGLATILVAFASFITMMIGPVVFATKVFQDYEYDKKEYDVGFWLAVVSAVMCLAATVLSIITYFCFRRIKRSRRDSLHSNAVRY